MTTKIESLTRPNFFPGQLIDYKDFNRLAEQSERINALLCRHLFESGGILVNAFQEFEILPLSGLACRIRPGVALLPNGQPLVLGSDLVVDLSDYRPAADSRSVLVSLRNVVKGQDRYVDREDSTITGFLTIGAEVEIVVSESVQAEDALEMFRITLEPSTTALRLATVAEEWHETLPAGAIDLRNRSRIVPQTYAPLSASQMLELRKSLYGIERAHGKMTKIYLVEDPFTAMQYLTQLHAELLNRPLQPLKVAFLVSEFAEKLSLFLDRLVRHAGNQRSNFDRTTLLSAVEVLESLKAREVLPRPLPLHALTTLYGLLETAVEYAERKFSLLNTVEEAFVDIRDRSFEFEDKIILAGHLFERIDLISSENEERYDLKASSGSLSRLLSTRYRNGDLVSLKGRFLKDGAVQLRFTVQHPDRPLIILMHQYVRRSGTTLQYEINGKHLLTDPCEYADLSNSWINRGLVVGADQLVPQENLLTIRVQKSDLDFGFFDLAVYQPSVLREVNEPLRRKAPPSRLAAGEVR